MNDLADPSPMLRDWTVFQARQAAALARYTPRPVTMPTGHVAEVVLPSCCCTCRSRED